MMESFECDTINSRQIMKKAIYIGAIIVLLLMINGLLHSIYDIWHKQDLLTSAQKQLDREKLENQKLKGELSYAQTPQFLEEQAHNKLFLVKPGEQEVLISQTLKNQNKSTKPNSQSLPNWQKWLNLFF
jgi:cell division protein FtsB